MELDKIIGELEHEAGFVFSEKFVEKLKQSFEDYARQFYANQSEQINTETEIFKGSYNP